MRPNHNQSNCGLRVEAFMHVHITTILKNIRTVWLLSLESIFVKSKGGILQILPPYL